MSQIDITLTCTDPELDGRKATVDYDYEPSEPASRDYPGAPARAYINSVSIQGDNVMARVLDDPDGIEDQVLDQLMQAWRQAEEDRCEDTMAYRAGY